MVITVGSTNFEALINKLLNNQLIQILPPSNIKLLIQIGNQPKPETANLITNHNNIQLVIFNYSDSIDHLLQHANLIITHAGAGSILSAINPIQPSPLTTTHIQVTPEYTLEIKPTTTRPKPRVIVVPNPGLMDNHQIDLAQQISNLGLAYSCSIDQLFPTIQKALLGPPPQSSSSSKELDPTPGPIKFRNLLDQQVGFSTSHT
ncbi:N-acetylglucosaminyldiphosphodolichol N-acetylglucosaminyltransferase catalytic subunit alg13 [Puccinia graminis f. sp. tritici]|uniref:UDP-N-acetylglucosamine transferase subunit ALG13 n=1 Tax=Puccinia graminis f. sp. tritici TaxID=56615 RepID=A0A5B0QR37_PUCGR|nr:N-acetylglucosaminyldiphosphodolichol N-acetylglucosaminyltransferase catalytic subunit alg13 [Puccinia graminis f. sp. tritici]